MRGGGPIVEPARRAFVLVMASALVAAGQSPPAAEGPKPKAVLKVGRQMYAPTVAFSPDGKTLASGGEDGAITLWDPATGRKVGTLGAGPNGLGPGADRDFVGWLVFSPDGRALTSTGMSRVFHIWDLTTHERRDVPAPPGASFGFTLSADGRDVVAAEQIHLKGAEKGEEQDDQIKGGAPGRPASEGRGAVAGERPDSKGAGKGKEQDVRIRNATPSRPASKSRTPGIRPFEIVASPDNQWIAWASYDGPIRLLRRVDASTLEAVTTIKGHPRSYVVDLAFSKYAPVLASADAGDDTVRLWRVPSGEPLAALGPYKKGAGGVEFLPDGRTLAVSGAEGFVRVWDLQDILDAAPAAPPHR